MVRQVFLTFIGVLMFAHSISAQRTQSVDQKPILKESKVFLNSKKSALQLPVYLNNATSQDELFLKYFNEYYQHLYNNDLLELDALETKIITEYPQYLKDFYGYFGIRKWLSLKNSPIETNNSSKQAAIEYFQKAAEQSIFTPKAIWTNILNQTQQKHPYPTFDHTIKIISKTFDPFISNNGALNILSFSIKPGSRNILISNGTDYPLEVLEWNFGTQKWVNISPTSGLNEFLGGHQLYAADINQDGLDDLIILRNPSNLTKNAISSVLVNQGNGRFTDIAPSIHLDKIYNASFAIIGDFNQDEKTDLLIGNKMNTTKLLLQDTNGKFISSSQSFVKDDIRNTIQDGVLTDLNGDGKSDILLTTQDGDNIAYVQNSSSTGFSLDFTNQADSLEISSINFGGNLLQGDVEKKSSVIFMLADVSNSLVQFSKAFFPKDTSFHNTELLKASKTNSLIRSTLPNELSLMEAGIWISTFDGMRILFSGGKTIEGILPFYEYNSTNHSIRIAQNEDLPYYVNSVAVTEYKQQPIFIFAGGGNAPIMKNTITSIDYRPDSTGKYHRIFDVQKENIGSVISYSIQDNKGKVHPRNITVQSRDNKGKNALQEWIWLPKDYILQTSHFSTLEKVPIGGDKIKKEDFKLKTTPNRTPSSNGISNKNQLKKSK